MSCKLLRSKASFWKLSIVIGLTILLVAGIALLIYIVSTFNAAKRPISYLPEINPGDLYYAPPGDSQFELMNSYFRLLANRDGNVEITTLDGETIISGFKFYSFHENEDERIGFKAVVLEMVNDSTLSIKGNGHSGEHIIIDISALRDKPKLNIRIKNQL
jgi:hypothetical protein